MCVHTKARKTLSRKKINLHDKKCGSSQLGQTVDPIRLQVELMHTILISMFYHVDCIVLYDSAHNSGRNNFCGSFVCLELFLFSSHQGQEMKVFDELGQVALLKSPRNS